MEAFNCVQLLLYLSDTPQSLIDWSIFILHLRRSDSGAFILNELYSPA